MAAFECSCITRWAHCFLKCEGQPRRDYKMEGITHPDLLKQGWVDVYDTTWESGGKNFEERHLLLSIMFGEGLKVDKLSHGDSYCFYQALHHPKDVLFKWLGAQAAERYRDQHSVFDEKKARVWNTIIDKLSDELTHRALFGIYIGDKDREFLQRIRWIAPKRYVVLGEGLEGTISTVHPSVAGATGEKHTEEEELGLGLGLGLIPGKPFEQDVQESYFPDRNTNSQSPTVAQAFETVHDSRAQGSPQAIEASQDQHIPQQAQALPRTPSTLCCSEGPHDESASGGNTAQAVKNGKQDTSKKENRLHTWGRAMKKACKDAIAVP